MAWSVLPTLVPVSPWQSTLVVDPTRARVQACPVRPCDGHCDDCYRLGISRPRDVLRQEVIETMNKQIDMNGPLFRFRWCNIGEQWAITNVRSVNETEHPPDWIAGIRTRGEVWAWTSIRVAILSVDGLSMEETKFLWTCWCKRWCRCVVFSSLNGAVLEMRKLDHFL
jgi:hypothetical protein